MRYSSFSSMSAGIVVGIMLGAVGAVMLSDSRSMRSTRRRAQKALHSAEDFLCDVKKRIM